jgi:hypothetical protein
MNNFQKLVLVIAIIILILSLIFIGIALSYAKNKSWPPMVPSCPDYWQMDGSGNNATCTNIKDLGICPPQGGQKHLVMNFNDPMYSGQNGLCAKYTWANNCKVTWDGITYGVNNPCQTTATNTSS